MFSIKDLYNCLVIDMVANKGNASAKSFYAKIKAIIYLLWFSPNYSCVFWLRVNQYLTKKKNGLAGYLSRRMNAKRIYKFGNDISCFAEIGPGLKIVHLSDIVIGRRSKVGKNLTILNGVSLGEKKISDHNMPTVGDNVYIGVGAKLLGNITIGDGAIIGALTFCDKSVPVNGIAYGNPMILKTYLNDNYLVK